MDRLTLIYLKELITKYEAFNMGDLGNRQTTTLRDGSGDTYAVDALTNRYNSIDSVNLDYDAAISPPTKGIKGCFYLTTVLVYAILLPYRGYRR